MLSFKYRIYPTKQQISEIETQLNFCRFLYNSALHERKSYYKKYEKSISYYDQEKQLIEIKKIFDIETKNIFAQVLQSTLKRLDNAYSNFFKRVKSGKTPGFPRFKNKTSFNSILFPQCDFYSGGIKIAREQKPKFKYHDKTEYYPVSTSINQKIIIYGITGQVKIKYHRPFEGNCKTISLKREGDLYFIILTCDNVNYPNRLKTR